MKRTDKNISTRQLIKHIANTDADLEWYPSTTDIINTVKHDIDNDDSSRWRTPSILDCGAGDGRVLNALTSSKKYAIEKSKPLLNALDRNIIILGTDFHQQTLLDKRVDIVFSNPPFSEYVAWSTKIITEANAGLIYLVIPDRWKGNNLISEALLAREAKATVIGEFDFLNAERKARARVNIVKIDLSFSRRHSGNSAKVDPFVLWFNSFFSIDARNDSSSIHELEKEKKERANASIKNELVTGADLIQVLEKFYQKEMLNLIETYKKLESIDPVLLKEMDVNLKAVCEALKLKIQGLKDRFWKELFDNLTTVTDKLTSQSRKKLFDVLTEHTHIDFSASNAYAIVIWVIKNSNHYLDDQLTSTFETMVDAANIKLYKSNLNTYGQEQWRYNRKPEGLERYSLEYRVVMHRVGGIFIGAYEWERPRCGLDERAITFLNDLRTVASNLGYDTSNYGSVETYEWDSRIKNQLWCKNLRTGKEEVLFEAAAFKNGNLHLMINQSFLIRFNIEMGRLKGWLKEPQNAADELDIPIEVAQESFKSNLQLEASSFLMLEHTKAA